MQAISCKIIFFLCLVFLTSAIFAETVELRHMDAAPDLYIGKTVTVKGDVALVKFDQDNSRAEILFLKFRNVDVIVRKGTPLYSKLIDMDIQYNEGVKVTGVVHNYNNSSSVFIEASEVSKSVSFGQFFLYTVYGVVALLVLGAITKTINEKKKVAPAIVNEVKSDESNDQKVS